jgi:hypothetical protein
MNDLELNEIEVGSIVKAPNVGDLSHFVTANKEYEVIEVSPPSLFIILDNYGERINCIYGYGCIYLNGARWQKVK